MQHNHTHNTSNKRLGIAIFLNAIIFIVELIGGLLTNSLALISDAIHNFSDFVALILSYFATKIALWNSNHDKTYGYVRIEIFAAFINSIVLVVIGIEIIYEAIRRIGHPEPVLGLWMIVIAVIGFIANAFSTVLLKEDAKRDLNMKSAHLHLFTDAIESFAVIVIGGLIYWFDWDILDPVISIAIGGFIIMSAWEIILETVNILTEGTPKGISVHDVVAMIQSIPGVSNVHHIHIWSLSSQFRALSAHVEVTDMLISDGNNLVARIEQELKQKFGINHPTIQLECGGCDEQDIIININKHYE
jgi:cobalt-zinc-cadmium efflux system protein